MSDPARKVVWDDEAPQVVWDVEGSPAPEVAPAPPARQPVGVGAAIGRGAGQGASLGFGDEAGGFGSWLASKVHPNTTGTGGAYAGGRDVERAANAQAKADQGLAYNAAELVGNVAVTPGLGIGGAKALGKVAPTFAQYLQGASLAPRAAKLALGGAGVGGVSAGGLSEADSAGGVAQDVAEGAALGGALGGAVPVLGAGARAAGRSVVGGAKKVFKQGADVAIAGLPGEIQAGARELVAPNAAGQALRDAARRGGENLDPMVRKITGLSDSVEQTIDKVTDWAQIRMKRAPIEQGMAAEGVDGTRALHRSAKPVAEMLEDIEAKLATAPDQIYERKGYHAFKELKGRIENVREHFAESLGSGGGGSAAADHFMELDQLKRQIGKIIKKVDRGGDPNAEASLKQHYQTLRAMLEDADTWGGTASGVQKELNAAWSPWIDSRKAYKDTVLSSMTLDKAADPFKALPRTDPRKVESALRGAGSAANDLEEEAMRRGLGDSVKLTRALGKHYDAPPELASAIERQGVDADALLANFDATKADRSAMRQLSEVTQAAPTVGKVANTMGTAERKRAAFQQEFPRLTSAASATKSAIGSAANTARNVTAGSAAATQHQQSASTDEKFREHLREQNRKKEGR